MAQKSKASDSQGYGLLIAAVVAIVAIVGLVMLFRGGASGQLVAMSGGNEPFYTNIGEAQARGLHLVSDPTNCPAEENLGGFGWYDFNNDFVGCEGYVTFGSGISANDHMRYTGWQSEPKAYRAVGGGMYTDAEGTYETFYRGEQGRAYREGRNRMGLETDSDRGTLVG